MYFISLYYCFFYTQKFSIKIYTCIDICIENTVISMLGFCPPLRNRWAFVRIPFKYIPVYEYMHG